MSIVARQSRSSHIEFVELVEYIDGMSGYTVVNYLGTRAGVHALTKTDLQYPIHVIKGDYRPKRYMSILDILLREGCGRRAAALILVVVPTDDPRSYSMRAYGNDAHTLGVKLSTHLIDTLARNGVAGPYDISLTRVGDEPLSTNRIGLALLSSS